MTDVTIIGTLTGNDKEGFEITEEESHKTHWVIARKSICKELEKIEWGVSIKIKGYINEKHQIVASKVFILLGED